MNYLTIAQFIFAIGTVLLIKELIKNRNTLKGYSLSGSLLTLIAMTFVLVQFSEFGDLIGLTAGLVQWMFWLFVTIFQINHKWRNRSMLKPVDAREILKYIPEGEIQEAINAFRRELQERKDR